MGWDGVTGGKRYRRIRVMHLAMGVWLASSPVMAATTNEIRTAETGSTETAPVSSPHPIQASFELLDGQIWVIFPPALASRIRQGNWDVFALLYRSDEVPPHKLAYILEDRGEYFLLKGNYLRQKSWTLDVMLAPPKGEAMQRTFSFFDRTLIKE